MAATPKYDSVFLPVSILAGSIIIAASIYYSSGAALTGGAAADPIGKQLPPVPTQQQAKPAGAKVDSKLVKADSDPVIGKKDAPITIAYWFDYQCPFCKQYEESVMPKVIADYVDTGKAKIVYKDFQFLGADSETLGVAARAVWEVAPTKFEAWHTSVFDNQGRENTGWATTDKIRSITQSVLGKADTDEVMALMASRGEIYLGELNADKQEGSSYGVSGTPTIIVGSQLLVGARSYSDVKAAIDAASK